jgi:hypothetical protein
VDDGCLFMIRCDCILIRLVDSIFSICILYIYIPSYLPLTLLCPPGFCQHCMGPIVGTGMLSISSCDCWPYSDLQRLWRQRLANRHASKKMQ